MRLRAWVMIKKVISGVMECSLRMLAPLKISARVARITVVGRRCDKHELQATGR